MSLPRTNTTVSFQVSACAALQANIEPTLLECVKFRTTSKQNFVVASVRALLDNSSASRIWVVAPTRAAITAGNVALLYFAHKPATDVRGNMITKNPH